VTSEITTASPKISGKPATLKPNVRELKLEIKAGKLLALSGIIGSGACFRE